MSRQYNEWYFRNENARDGFNVAWDMWNSERESCEGIHRVIFEWTNPFNYCGKRSRFSLRDPHDSADCGKSFQFMPGRSTQFRRAEMTAKRAEKRKQKETRSERLDHEINRLLSACAPFPPTKPSDN